MKAFNKNRFLVLKVYFKVFLKRLPALSLYIAIFLVISVLMTKYHGSASPIAYTETKTDVAFFDADGTALTKGLKEDLAGSADFVNIEDKKDAVQDALYFHMAQYVIRIPKGFTQDFLHGKNVKIQRTVGQEVSSSITMNLMVDRYLNTARLIAGNTPGISQQQLAERVKDSLSEKTAVTMKTYGAKNNLGTAANYFIYLCYSIIILMFFGVTTIQMVFRKKDLQSRNLVSPLSQTKADLQIFAGQILLMLIVCALGIALGIALCGTDIIGENFAFFCLNTVCAGLACLCMSLLVGNLVKNNGAQHGIANVLSLGLCFVSGVFVPQEYLSGSVLSAAHFTPTYWYVKSVNDIYKLTSFTPETLMPVYQSMLIQLGFAAAFFILSLVVTKQKRISVD